MASNFERYLYYRVGEDAAKVKSLMTAFATGEPIRIDGQDEKFAAGRGDTAMTLATIKKYWEKYQVLLDPHGAVGVAVAEENPLTGTATLCLETAHPGKFPAAIGQALGDESLAAHPGLEALKTLPLRKTILKPELNVIEEFMTNECGK